uniref:RRM domain-containing protein n=1 Tax=Macrostomum lignano TaxID=282301 RepID=A0A1I8HSQ7_9PLAT
MKVRFTKPVVPGQTVCTRMWRAEQPAGRVLIECVVKETGEVCLSGGYVDTVPSSASGASSPAATDAAAAGGSAAIFNVIAAKLTPTLTCRRCQCRLLVEFEHPGRASQLDRPACTRASRSRGKSDCELILSEATFMDLVAGKVNAQKAFMSGQLKLKGNIMLKPAVPAMLYELVMVPPPQSTAANAQDSLVSAASYPSVAMQKALTGVPISKLPPKNFSTQPVAPVPTVVSPSAALDSNNSDSFIDDYSSQSDLFVGDLSPELENHQLKEAFSAYGTVTECKIIKDMHTQKPKGYGFVAFATRDEAQEALRGMHGRILGSRPIRTNWAVRKPSQTPADPRPLDYGEVVQAASVSNTTVYVGGINYGLCGFCFADKALHQIPERAGRRSCHNGRDVISIPDFEDGVGSGVTQKSVHDQVPERRDPTRVAEESSDSEDPASSSTPSPTGRFGSRGLAGAVTAVAELLLAEGRDAALALGSACAFPWALDCAPLLPEMPGSASKETVGSRWSSCRASSSLLGAIRTNVLRSTIRSMPMEIPSSTWPFVAPWFRPQQPQQHLQGAPPLNYRSFHRPARLVALGRQSLQHPWLARHQEGDRLRPDYSPAFQPIGTVNTLGIREYVEQYHGLQVGEPDPHTQIRPKPLDRVASAGAQSVQQP